MKIRNAVVVFLAAAYAALAPLTGMGLAEIGESAGFAALVLLCMFALFSAGWIGGGDAKLIAVVALWLGAGNAGLFLLWVAAFGGLLTVAILQLRSVRLPAPCLSVTWIARLRAPKSGIPYGAAIASAALYVFPKTQWMTHWMTVLF